MTGAPNGAEPPAAGSTVPVPVVVGRVRESLGGDPEARFVVAVSGGLDSMALLHAMIRAGLRGRIAAVATFDHGTGAAATEAAARVARVADEHGLRCEAGRAPDGTAATEAAWRDRRHAFLRDVARRQRASLVTAHTLDDQLETVAMRILRGAGARGLAGLAAQSDVLRPLLATRRSDLADFVHERRIAFATDPSNDDRRYFRNRMRHDLLPALRTANAGFDDWLLDLSARAARLRRDIESHVGDYPLREESPGCFVLDRAVLAGFSPPELATLWPALAARAGVTLDRRGTARVSRFTGTGSTGGRVQLSGKHEVVLRRTEIAIGPLGNAGVSRRKAAR